MLHNKSAFTLIELLIVIAILAVLAGAALPYVQSYIQEGRLSKAKSDLNEIAKALMLYETMEGPYSHSTVEQIAGRYLNSSLVDPWGLPYRVATGAGLVFSYGPDRMPGNFDDITANYQPPLALVSARWIDANSSGAVDSQNRPDYLALQFSRKIASESKAIKDPENAYNYFWCSSTDSIDLAFDWKNLKLDNSGSLVTLPLAKGVSDAFTAGSDTFFVRNGDGLRDLASVTANPGGNRCISSQPVLITR